MSNSIFENRHTSAQTLSEPLAGVAPQPNHARRLATARGIMAELSAVAPSALEQSTNARAAGHAARNRISLGIDDIDGHLSGGLKRAGVHEVFSANHGDEASASGFAAGLSACAGRDRPGPVLWIDTAVAIADDGLLWPPGLADWGIAPDRLIRATARNARDALRMADDALACSALASVVLELRGPMPALDLTALRRLHLSAEGSGVPCLILRFGAEPIASPALTRWSIAARASGNGLGGAEGRSSAPDDWLDAGLARRLVGHPRFDAALARHRGGGLGNWSLEWCPDVQCFVSPASPALSEPAVPPVQHRPYRAVSAA
jgi:protein ImuA